MSMLSKKYFHDEKAAFAHLEASLWNDGVICPHCGSVDSARRLHGVKDKKGRVRNGLWKCYAKECRKQFTARVGTVFESAHIPLPKMLQAVYLMTASKKGISSHQLHRTLEITYKSAWFLAHRIREAMRDGTLAPMGGAGGIVEVDETYIGKQAGHAKGRGAAHKNIVLTLVERGGRARSHHITSFGVAEVVPIVRSNVRRESRLMSDEARQYVNVGQEFADHGSVNHSTYEWGRGDVHTNTVEGYYSIFKRGMKGVYQHCSEKHLHRYLAEFDFRYSNRVALGVDDTGRADRALKGITGKRLTYRNPNEIAVGG
ncbi:MAG: IS1595 family transposase [Pseudolabrys sp.]|nr:IS1595 family transposase [Pseudolabrys sp.]